MPRRELLQLAKTYNPAKHCVTGWYISEKLDGCRAFWDGGISRDLPTLDIPWASTTNPKTGERKDKIKKTATGLWSRYGNPIMAPDWFLDTLPKCPLDGELFAGRGQFQTCRSIISRDEPDERWSNIQFRVYGSPPLASLFQDGEIKNANMHETIVGEACFEFASEQVSSVEDGATFEDELRFLREKIIDAGTEFLYGDETVVLHGQTLIETDSSNTNFINNYFDRVLKYGGEGVMFRDPESVWTPKRVKTLLKFKPFHDDEATIIGFIAGRLGKQGNLLGKIGTLVVEWKGVEFELGTGMTWLEREIKGQRDFEYACLNPGERLPDHVEGAHFAIGDRVTFKYRELSDDGIPKEARIWRKT